MKNINNTAPLIKAIDPPAMEKRERISTKILKINT